MSAPTRVIYPRRQALYMRIPELIGFVCRPGRPGKSGACGALIKGLSDLKEQGLVENCKTPGGTPPPPLPWR